MSRSRRPNRRSDAIVREPVVEASLRLFAALTAVLADSRGEIGGTATERIVLAHLLTSRDRSLAAADLCRRTGLTPAAMTSLVARMEVDGLMVRVRDEHDRRRYRLVPSRRAEQLLGAALQPVLEEYRGLAGGGAPAAGDEASAELHLRRLATAMEAVAPGYDAEARPH